MFQGDDGDIYQSLPELSNFSEPDQEFLDFLTEKPIEIFNEELYQGLKSANGDSDAIPVNVLPGQFWEDSSHTSDAQINSYESLPIPTYNVPAETVKITLESDHSSIPSTVDEPSNSSINFGETPQEYCNPPVSDFPAKAKRSRRKTKAPKRKLYEVDTPFSDEEEEKKRLNAVKAKKNREKRAKLVEELQEENSKLMSVIEEKDKMLIQQQHEIERLKKGSSLNSSKLQTLKEVVDSLVAENTNRDSNIIFQTL